MISFMEKHVESCPVCQADTDIKDEIAKITEIILPESKIPKAIRLQSEADDDEDEDYEADTDVDEVEDEDTPVDEDEEEDVYVDEDDDFEDEPDLLGD
jgi:hypothetical protein